MGLHPDDPSFNVRARPRIVKDSAALKEGRWDCATCSVQWHHVLSGQSATRRENDVIAIAEEMWPHFVFCHFRNIRFLWDGDQNGETAFLETYHADEKGAIYTSTAWATTRQGMRPRIARTMRPACMATTSTLAMGWLPGRRDWVIYRGSWPVWRSEGAEKESWNDASKGLTRMDS